MSNNQMISVPRELVEFAVGFKRNGHKNLTDQRSDQDNAQDKLRALLERPAEQHQGEPVETAVFNDPLYNAESDARNASSLLEEVLEWFDDGVGRSQAEFKLMRKIGAWLGRSAPSADGESDECAHSYANGVGCPECGKEFGAEPSAPKCKYCGDTGQIMVGRSGDTSDGDAPVLGPCEDCERGAPVEPVDPVREALRAFVVAAYPVANQLSERGHNWSEAYLDEALLLARTALEPKQ